MKSPSLTLLLLASLGLAACGGGSDPTPTPTPAPAPTPTPAPAPTPAPSPAPSPAPAISGTAYGAAAITSGSVEMVCQDGVRSAALDASGRFSFTVKPDSGSCLLQVADATLRQKYHGAITGSGTANLHPVSELVMASMYKQAPELSYAAYKTSSSRTSISPATLLAAQNQIQDLLGTAMGLSGSVKSLMESGFSSDAKATLDGLAAKVGGTPTSELATVVAYTSDNRDVASYLSGFRGRLGMFVSAGYWFAPSPDKVDFRIWTGPGGVMSCESPEPPAGCHLLGVFTALASKTTPKTWTLYLPQALGGDEIDEFDSLDEIKQVVAAELSALNNLLRTANSDTSRNYLTGDETAAIIKTALNQRPAGIAEFHAALLDEFRKRGLPTSDRDATVDLPTPTTGAGNRCKTTKPPFSDEWIQTHFAYWQAASAHDAYVKCTATKSAAECKPFDDQEVKLCAYATKVCLGLVTNKANCPG